MGRRRPPARLRPVVLLSLVLALCAGCGKDATAPPTIRHPSGHSDVVIRIDAGAGQMSLPSDFGTPPLMVVTGDGMLYLRKEEATTQGIVWPLVSRRVTESDLQTLLRRAQEQGLLAAPPDYSPPTSVQDAGTTRVLLDADGTSWSHQADGLGAAGNEHGARARLQHFVENAMRWARGPASPRAREITPTVLRVMAGALPYDAHPDGRVGRWPAGARIHLAGIGTCRVVRDRAAVHALTTRADRFYRDQGELFGVSAAVLLPGDSCTAQGGS
jgi:hypothetical protein